MNKLRHAAATMKAAFAESPTLETLAIIDTTLNAIVFLALVWMVLR
jgi:hypothetical protein